MGGVTGRFVFMTLGKARCPVSRVSGSSDSRISGGVSGVDPCRLVLVSVQSSHKTGQDALSPRPRDLFSTEQGHAALDVSAERAFD